MVRELVSDVCKGCIEKGGWNDDEREFDRTLANENLTKRQRSARGCHSGAKRRAFLKYYSGGTKGCYRVLVKFGSKE